MIQPKSLQQRLSIFLILPVACLLILMGIAGFIYARDLMLSQWREASVLKLQRAAHQVDMRLARVKDWVQIFHQTSSIQETEEIHDLAIAQLKQQAGVDQVLYPAYVRIVRSLPIGGRRGRAAEEGEMGSRVKHGVDPLAELHHALGVFDRATNDLEVRVFELERRVANDGPHRIALVEKASHQMAPEETCCAGDQADSEVIEWLRGRH